MLRAFLCLLAFVVAASQAPVHVSAANSENQNQSRSSQAKRRGQGSDKKRHHRRATNSKQKSGRQAPRRGHDAKRKAAQRGKYRAATKRKASQRNKASQAAQPWQAHNRERLKDALEDLKGRGLPAGTDLSAALGSEATMEDVMLLEARIKRLREIAAMRRANPRRRSEPQAGQSSRERRAAKAHQTAHEHARKHAKNHARNVARDRAQRKHSGKQRAAMKRASRAPTTRPGNSR